MIGLAVKAPLSIEELIEELKPRLNTLTPDELEYYNKEYGIAFAIENGEITDAFQEDDYELEM